VVYPLPLSVGTCTYTCTSRYSYIHMFLLVLMYVQVPTHRWFLERGVGLPTHIKQVHMYVHAPDYIMFKWWAGGEQRD
jgi:hypothetical protein